MSGQTPEQLEKSYTDLDYTQDKRRQIADKIIAKAIENEDPEMLTQGMKALDGMDKNSLGRLKLNQKENENKTNNNTNEVMSSLLIELANRRTNGGRREVVGSSVPGSKLPESRRPKYDPSVRDASAGSENTNDFTARVEMAKA